MRRRYATGGLAMAVGGGAEDEDDAPLTGALIPTPGKAPAMPVSEATSALSAARDRLMKQREPDKSAQWLAMAQGMLAPTKTGGFGESLGRTAGLVAEARETERERVTDIDEKLLDTEVKLEQIARGYGRSAAMREFEALTQGMPEDDVTRSRRIKLGLDPRAVGSGQITQATIDGLTELVANSQALIAKRKEFGKLTGSARSNRIDEAFTSIQGIDENARNIDLAIAALEGGAKSGFIEDMLPSFRASSIMLDTVQKRLGLDVVGETTFGALSKGELELALATAIPLTLEPPELIQWLKDRKAAQLKLRAYFITQMDFLEQGGTINGFMRDQERKMAAAGGGGGVASTGGGGGGGGAPLAGGLDSLSNEALEAAIREAGG